MSSECLHWKVEKAELMLNSLGPMWGPDDHSNRRSIRTGIIKKGIMRGFELKLDKWIKFEYDQVMNKYYHQITKNEGLL